MPHLSCLDKFTMKETSHSTTKQRNTLTASQFFFFRRKMKIREVTKTNEINLISAFQCFHRNFYNGSSSTKLEATCVLCVCAFVSALTTMDIPSALFIHYQ